ncbi:MAG: G/U mismatch-specific DNA glycosylase [Acidimicrobiia bacterium]
MAIHNELSGYWRPSKEDLAAAVGNSIPDVVAPALKVLFCGINPGLWSGAVGHHFARPGNRFWKVLEAAGLTDRLLSPFEDEKLISFGLGVTNLVARATRSAEDLTDEELRLGVERMERESARFAPRFVAFLGIGAYRTAFQRQRATVGEQPECLGGSRLWLLPNPSGLQARYQLPELAEAFGALRRASFG